MNISQPDMRSLKGRLSPANYEAALRSLAANDFPEKSMRRLMCSCVAAVMRLYEGNFPVDLGVIIGPFSIGLYRIDEEGAPTGFFGGIAFEMESETKVRSIAPHATFTPGLEFDFFLSLLTEIEGALAKGDLFDTLAGTWALASADTANVLAS